MSSTQVGRNLSGDMARGEFDAEAEVVQQDLPETVDKTPESGDTQATGGPGGMGEFEVDDDEPVKPGGMGRDKYVVDDL